MPRFFLISRTLQKGRFIALEIGRVLIEETYLYFVLHEYKCFSSVLFLNKIWNIFYHSENKYEIKYLPTLKMENYDAKLFWYNDSFLFVYTIK